MTERKIYLIVDNETGEPQVAYCNESNAKNHIKNNSDFSVYSVMLREEKKQ